MVGLTVLVIAVTFVIATFTALTALVLVYRQERRSGRIVLLGGVSWHPSDADIRQAIGSAPGGLLDSDGRPQLIRD